MRANRTSWAGTSLEAYAALLENVSVFKYLGRVMTALDDECPAVVGKPQRARKSWVRV